jgi:hypothetical protein
MTSEASEGLGNQAKSYPELSEVGTITLDRDSLDRKQIKPELFFAVTEKKGKCDPIGVRTVSTNFRQTQRIMVCCFRACR